MKYFLFLLLPLFLFGFGIVGWTTNSDRVVVVHATKVGGLPLVRLRMQQQGSAEQAPQPPDAPERPPQLEDPELVPDSELSKPIIPVPPKDESTSEVVPQESVPSVPETNPPQQAAEEAAGNEEHAPASIPIEASSPAMDETQSKSEPTSGVSDPRDPNWDASRPILGENVPDWVKVGLSQGEEHRFAIGTTFATEMTQCREDFDSMLLAEVQNYLDKHILKEVTADQLTLLTKKYVEDHMLVADKEFDNVQDRPSGTYHQLWRQIFISKSQLETIRGWEQSHIIRKRTTQVGAIGGVALAGMVLLSGMVGFFAKREKAKLKG